MVDRSSQKKETCTVVSLGLKHLVVVTLAGALVELTERDSDKNVVLEDDPRSGAVDPEIQIGGVALNDVRGSKTFLGKATP